MADKDLAFQFSGPYVQTFMQAIDEQLAINDPVVAYFYLLSIETAVSPQLDTIGGMVGYPWPNAPTGIFGDNNFLFGAAADFPMIDVLTGFGSTGSPGVGGLLSSSSPAIGNKIPIGFYRLLLVEVAKIKADGLSMISIDRLCKVFGEDYIIEQTADVAVYLTLDTYTSFPETSDTMGLTGLDPAYANLGGFLWTSDPASHPDSDIYITFITQIGAGYLWLIQQIFNRFTTAPQIYVSQGA